MSHALAKKIFNHAVELPANQRAAYLDEACQGDFSLRAIVESLLSFHRADTTHSGTTNQVSGHDVGPGDSLGPYRIIGILGEGGMGIVYLATQAAPVRRRVALKVLKPGMDSKAVLARFQAEQQAMALMDHSGITTVLQTGLTPAGRPWFAMEYIEGERLDVYCDRKRLDTNSRLKLFARICDAVQHAHQKGVIHRDLKPSNILVTLDDNGIAQPHIIDFGIAKATSQPLTEETLLTSHGQLVGTLAYMSPEQLNVSADFVDTRSDVYALGVILYELLSGQLPFEPGTMHEDGIDSIRKTIRDTTPPKPSTRLTSIDREEAARIAGARNTRIEDLERQLRRELEWIPLKALRKAPDERYTSPESLASDVRRYLGGEPLEAGPPSRVYRMKKILKKNKVPAATTAGFVFLLLAATAVSLSLLWSANEAKLQAQQEATRAEAVQAFVTNMLASVDPRKAGSMDKALMKLVLSDAAERVGENFQNQPQVEANIQQIIGSTYHHLGLHDQAERHLEKSVALYRGSLGDQDANTTKSIMERANLAMNRGQYDKAEAGYREVLNTRRTLLGEEHPETLETQSNLGELLRRQGYLDEAMDLVSRTLEANRRIRGNENRYTLHTIDNMGILMAMSGDYEQAEEYFIEAQDIRIQTMGEEHPETLHSMGNMATLYWSQERFDEAHAQYLRVLEIRLRVEGDEHPSTLRLQGNLAGLLQDMERYDECEQIRRKVLKTKQRVLGEAHPSTLNEYIGLGSYYLTQAQLEEAEHWFQLAWEGRRETLGDDHPDTLSAKARIGMVMRDIGRYEESQAYLEDVYAMSCQRHGKDSPDAHLILKEMVLLYDAWERPTDVQRCRELLGDSESVAIAQ
ncbi:MAG: serine/threonine-protein kinase [Planctomycetota bacterium]|nr:serine/threonine-protein kinase [Planctomycetota bacterium]